MAENNVFADLLAKLNEKTSKSGGRVYHPTPGKTKIRLVLEPGTEPREFYQEVTTSFGKTRYMALGVILEAPDLPKDYTPNIVGIVLPLTVLKAIVGNLAEGFELFDLKMGHGISIDREGKGKNDTKYQVNPSPRSVDVSGLNLEFPEGGLEEMARAYTTKSAEMGTPSSDGPGETKASGGNIPW